MTTMHINPDKIREVIGTGGSMYIQKIVAESGVKIDIEDDGTCYHRCCQGIDAAQGEAR